MTPGFLKEYLFSWLEGPTHPRPVFVTFFVTSRCNAVCGHCFYRKTAEDVLSKPELDAEQIDRIAWGMPSFYKLLISGGEPFLRTDLEKICLSFIKHCGVRQITIPTNGLLTERILEVVGRLAADTSAQIELAPSIDGVGELHDQIRGVPGAFEKLIETYRQVQALADRTQNLFLRFNLTFSAMNQDRVDEVIDYVTEELGCNSLDMVLIRGEAFEPSWKEVDPDKYLRAAERICRIKRSKPGLLSGVLTRRTLAEKKIIADRLRGVPDSLPCLAGSRIAIISETGEVYPCELRLESFGNLTDHDYRFDAVWNGQAARRFRRSLAQEGCTCTFETAVTSSLSYSPSHLARIILGR